MKTKVLRKLFLGFIQLHILHHANQAPFFGSWMMEELREHGYDISPGTLYPILHSMEKNGLLYQKESKEQGKIRKYYSITPLGIDVLETGKKQAKELVDEIID